MKLLKLIPDNTNIRFLKWQWPFFISNIALMLASVVLLFTHGLNLGVDFVGGQMIRVTFERSATAPVQQLENAVGKLGYGEPVVQTFGKPNEISLRMKLPEGTEAQPQLADAMARKITESIKQSFPDARIDGVDSVSGKVSGELFKTGMIALGLAMIGISIYIWVRFEWQFGVGALFALLQDILLTVGMFSWTQMEFDLNIVAALLTLLGYSLNDKIVVYDRIRENLKKHRRMPMAELLDLSVNETLSRTVVTSLSMLITLLALLLLGPDVIFGFTAAITLGIFIGTYSSIFMSAPILIWLGVKSDSFVTTESAIDRQERLAREQGSPQV
ncbi:protein translocase subunit SecF [Novosphingobium panipatense]|uniref:Protein-export membrane protein SecF n=1 Tax=Novosphingobium panipatense TaxID=428991 RepID=A0ABY1Q515_9SPHN|nr:protein translocase subunit SecF [Novosphingobium panipatense]SMP55718.1 protein translocase subunit secF [Novosphingobium panipatense]